MSADMSRLCVCIIDAEPAVADATMPGEACLGLRYEEISCTAASSMLANELLLLEPRLRTARLPVAIGEIEELEPDAGMPTELDPWVALAGVSLRSYEGSLDHSVLNTSRIKSDWSLALAFVAGSSLVDVDSFGKCAGAEGVCAGDAGSDGSLIKLSRARYLVRSQLGEGCRQIRSRQANVG